MINESAVVVLSGGLDSTILTYLARVKHSNLHAISFNYGQKQVHELAMASWTCNNLAIPHKVIDLYGLGEIAHKVSSNINGSPIDMPSIKAVLGEPQPVTYVPFRNLILLSYAFAYAEANDLQVIYSGLQHHDLYGYWDTSENFVNNLNRVAADNRKHKIRIETPFIRMSKVDEIREALALEDEFGLEVRLDKTITCYDPDSRGHACGKCPSCAERIQAFINVGIPDPAIYQKPLRWDKLLGTKHE